MPDEEECIDGKKLKDLMFMESKEYWKHYAIFEGRMNYFGKLLTFFPWFCAFAMAGFFLFILGYIAQDADVFHLGVSIIITVIVSTSLWALVAKILFERHKARICKNYNEKSREAISKESKQ